MCTVHLITMQQLTQHTSVRSLIAKTQEKCADTGDETGDMNYVRQRSARSVAVAGDSPELMSSHGFLSS